jgi:hypothetical protein
MKGMQLIPFFALTPYPVIQQHDNKSMSSKDATSLHAIDSCKTVEPNNYLLLDKESWWFKVVDTGGDRASQRKNDRWPSRVGEVG